MVQYSFELLIRLFSDNNALGYYPKLVILRRTMHHGGAFGDQAH